jgi:DNA-binding MarR family transcriptional regulator
LIDGVRTLFHLLKAAAERVHGDGERSAARRGVLLSLHEKELQTVPQIAAARPVSRQHIQTVVNALLDDGLVERTANPDHQRSHLIRLTASGRDRIRMILQREAAIFAELPLPLDTEQLRRSTATLNAVAQAFHPENVDAAIRRIDSKP